MAAPCSNTSPVVVWVVVNAALSVMLPPKMRMGPSMVNAEACVMLAVLVVLPKVKPVAEALTVKVEGNDTAAEKLAPKG